MGKVAVLGLGYVGLPLAVEFGKNSNCSCVGFDISRDRINELASGIDRTGSVAREDLILASRNILYSSNEEDLHECNTYIISVPTPIDQYKIPDLSRLRAATETVSRYLKKEDIVIYESTVYPGLTEEEMVPIIESISKLKLNKDFYVGYSPERVNPGDKHHKLTDITKLISGSSQLALDKLEYLYGELIGLRTHRVKNIKIAESAKIIENIQRDINIALMNELSMIFNLLNINTKEVLEAASTKWNFIPFTPGLVGGHCIGVDPYYLTHKASSMGYYPDVILSGRRVNDSMGHYIAKQTVKCMINKKINVPGASVLILGFTFKENCPDIRNTKVLDIHRELEEYNTTVDVYDPWVDAEDIKNTYHIEKIDSIHDKKYDVIILAVAHECFSNLGAKYILTLAKEESVIVDIKNIFPPNFSDVSL